MIKILFFNFLIYFGEIFYIKRYLRYFVVKLFNFVKFDFLCFMDYEFVENNINRNILLFLI